MVGVFISPAPLAYVPNAQCDDDDAAPAHTATKKPFKPATIGAKGGLRTKNFAASTVQRKKAI